MLSISWQEKTASSPAVTEIFFPSNRLPSRNELTRSSSGVPARLRRRTTSLRIFPSRDTSRKRTDPSHPSEVLSRGFGSGSRTGIDRRSEGLGRVREPPETVEPLAKIRWRRIRPHRLATTIPVHPRRSTRRTALASDSPSTRCPRGVNSDRQDLSSFATISTGTNDTEFSRARDQRDRLTLLTPSSEAIRSTLAPARFLRATYATASSRSSRE
jgi:hypothetical protein